MVEMNSLFICRNIEKEDLYLDYAKYFKRYLIMLQSKGLKVFDFLMSAGITMYQTGTIEEAVSLADHLLYHAKRKKNCIFTELEDHQYYSDRNDTKTNRFLLLMILS